MFKLFLTASGLQGAEAGANLRKWLAVQDPRSHNLQAVRRAYLPPIEQYRETIPQKWWQRLLKRPVQYRLRIRRVFPQSINCRCVII